MNKFGLTLSAVCLLCYANLTFGQFVQTGGPNGGYVNALAVKGETVFAGTSGGGVFLSTNNGSSWTPINAGLTDLNVTVITFAGNDIFAGTLSGGIFLSKNNGALWNPVDSGAPGYIYNNQFLYRSVTAIAVSGNDIFAGFNGRGVFLSKDYGASWDSANTGITGIYASSFIITGSKVLVAIEGNYISSVYLSTNNGASWTKSNSGLPGFVYNNGFFNAYAFVPVTALTVIGSDIFAGTSSAGIYHSTDSGASWSEANMGLKDSSFVRAFAAYGNHIFAATRGGVYHSTNNGASWFSVNTGLMDSVNVYALAVNDKYIFAGTQIYSGSSDGRVWRRPLSDIVSARLYNQQNFPIQTKAHVRASGSLHSGVLLNYSIQSNCFVHLGIYSISGKRAAVIDQGYKTPGEYSVRIADGLIPAGLYVYRFKAGGYQESNRIMVMK
jgi:photosystem II stability/assembly factor-like uncharacterized protein